MAKKLSPPQRKEVKSEHKCLSNSFLDGYSNGKTDLVPSELCLTHAEDAIINNHPSLVGYINNTQASKSFSYLYDNWQNREPLARLLKPKGFLGSLLHIEIEKIDNPRDAMLKEFPIYEPKNESQLNNLLQKRSVIGFNVLAELALKRRENEILAAAVFISTPPPSKRHMDFELFRRKIAIYPDRTTQASITESVEKAKATARKVATYNISRPFRG